MTTATKTTRTLHLHTNGTYTRHDAPLSDSGEVAFDEAYKTIDCQMIEFLHIGRHASGCDIELLCDEEGALTASPTANPVAMLARGVFGMRESFLRAPLFGDVLLVATDPKTAQAVDVPEDVIAELDDLLTQYLAK